MRRGGVRRIVADAHGDLYLTSPRRILRLRRGSRSYEQDLTAASQLTSIRSVAVASDGTVWFGGSNGLARYEPARDSFTTYFAVNNASSLAAEAGIAWLGTSDGALRYRQGAATCQSASDAADRSRDSCQRIPVSDAPIGQRGVTALSVAGKDAIWLGTPNGIRRLRRDRLPGTPGRGGDGQRPAPRHRQRAAKHCLRHRQRRRIVVWGLDRVLQRELTQVYRDRRGDLWLAFAQSGVVRLDSTGSWTALTPDGAAPIGANLNDIFEDRDGRLWFRQRRSRRQHLRPWQ